MFLTKLSPVLAESISRQIQVLPSRVLFSSKSTESPSSQTRRNERDGNSGETNTQSGQSRKSEVNSSAESKYGGKGPGAVSQRTEENVLREKSSTSGINSQQKRSFLTSGLLQWKTAGSPSLVDKQSSSPGSPSSADKQSSSPSSADKQSSSQRDSSESFVSSSAKKDSDLNDTGFRNLEFYPEKPGDFLKQKSNKESIGASYSSQTHNPSKTGKEADAKYLDEALAGKSGPLVEGSGKSQQRAGSSQGSSNSSSGKRNFSTSGATFDVVSSGKGSRTSGQQSSQNSTSKDSSPESRVPKEKRDAKGRPESIGGAEMGGILEDEAHTGEPGIAGTKLSSEEEANLRKPPSISKIVDTVKEKVLHKGTKH